MLPALVDLAVLLLGAGVATAAPVGAPTSEERRAAPASELSESRAVELALGNPMLEAVLDGHLAAAQADVTFARRWSNPQLSYTREQLLGSGALGEDYLGVSQRLEISGQRALRRDAAEQRVAAQSLRNEAHRAELVARVRAAYAEALYEQERLVVFDRWRARVQGAVAVIAAREHEGDVSRFDAARIRQELRILEARIARAEGARQRAWGELRRAMATVESHSEPTRLVGPLLPRSVPVPDDASIAAAPPIRALEQEADAAATEGRAARRLWVPPLTLGGGYKGVDTGMGRQSGFTASASIALPLRSRGKAQVEEAAAHSARLHGEAGLLATRVRAHQAELIARHRVLRAGLRDARDEGLADLAEVAYRGGEIGVAGLLDAYRGAHEGLHAELDLAVDIRMTQVELDRLHGKTRP